jgi:hypothetical protein
VEAAMAATGPASGNSIGASARTRWSMPVYRGASGPEVSMPRHSVGESPCRPRVAPEPPQGHDDNCPEQAGRAFATLAHFRGVSHARSSSIWSQALFDRLRCARHPKNS